MSRGCHEDPRDPRLQPRQPRRRVRDRSRARRRSARRACSRSSGRPAPARARCSTRCASRCSIARRGCRAAARSRSGDDEPTALGAQDVRSLLRRGASQGWAEVDFESGDARRYRARWSVRRARGASDGRFQDEQITLTSLDPGDPAPAASGSAARRPRRSSAIQQRLGLSFDQFRRSALLAQGEFAAFLRADGSERSELLERMTGTEIYSRLSVAAHLKAALAEQQLRDASGRGARDRGARRDARAAAEAELALAQDARAATRARLAPAERAARWLAEAERRAACVRRRREASAAAEQAALPPRPSAPSSRCAGAPRRCARVGRGRAARSPARERSHRRRAGRRRRGGRTRSATSRADARSSTAIRGARIASGCHAPDPAPGRRGDPRAAAAHTRERQDRRAARPRGRRAAAREAAPTRGATRRGSTARSQRRSRVAQHRRRSRADARDVRPGRGRDRDVSDRGVLRLARARAPRPEVAGWPELDARLAQHAELAPRSRGSTARSPSTPAARRRCSPSATRRRLSTARRSSEARRGTARGVPVPAAPRADARRRRQRRRTRRALRVGEVDRLARARRRGARRRDRARRARSPARRARPAIAADVEQRRRRRARARERRGAAHGAGARRRRSCGGPPATSTRAPSSSTGEPCPLCGATEHPWRDRGAFDTLIADAEARLAEAGRARRGGGRAARARSTARDEHARRAPRLVASSRDGRGTRAAAGAAWREQLADARRAAARRRSGERRRAAARRRPRRGRARRARDARVARAARPRPSRRPSQEAHARVQRARPRSSSTRDTLASCRRRSPRTTPRSSAYAASAPASSSDTPSLTAAIAAAIARWQAALPDARRSRAPGPRRCSARAVARALASARIGERDASARGGAGQGSPIAVARRTADRWPSADAALDACAGRDRSRRARGRARARRADGAARRGREAGATS